MTNTQANKGPADMSESKKGIVDIFDDVFGFRSRWKNVSEQDRERHQSWWSSYISRRDQQRLDGLSHVLGKVNRTIVQNETNVTVEDLKQTPMRLTRNKASAVVQIDKKYASGVLNEHDAERQARRLVGLKAHNYRKVAELKWSPAGIEAESDVLKLLEVQRIERMFIGQYAAAGPMFTQLVAEELGLLAANWSDNVYLALSGREYLPEDLLEDARAMMVAAHGEEVVERVDQLCNDFYAMKSISSNMSNTVRAAALDIVEKICDLLRLDKTNSKRITSDQDHDETMGTSPRTMSLEDYEALMEAAMVNMADARSMAEMSGEDAQQCVAAADVGDEDSEGEGDSGIGLGHQEEGVFSLDDLLARLERAQSNLQHIYQQEATRILKSIRVAQTEQQLKPGSWAKQARNRHITGHDRADLNRIVSAFTQLQVDLEAAWEREQPHGKINVPAAMAARGTHLDLFDKWVDHGDDVSMCETVVLMDMSGSMGSIMESTSRSMWLIKAASDMLGMPCTVIGYDDEAQVLLLPEHDASRGRSRPAWGSHGGTSPSQALDMARTVFARSPYRNKLMVSLTDGGWNLEWGHETYGSPGEIIQDLNRSGVNTAMVYLNYRNSDYDQNGLASSVAQRQQDRKNRIHEIVEKDIFKNRFDFLDHCKTLKYYHHQHFFVAHSSEDVTSAIERMIRETMTLHV